MQTWRRYWYVFAALFVLAALAVGSWIWSGYTAGSSSNSNAKKTLSLQGTVAHAQGTVTVTPGTSALWWKGAHLVAPSVHIDAPIETVGMTPDGNMAVPSQNQWDGVGWYANGPVPGEQGSAVIDGHLDRPGGAPAVFWNLRELHAGDTVMVVTHDGKTLHFRVMASQAYAPQDAPLATIFGNNSGHYLNLITCAGQWIASEHQTTQRLVVYTEFVS